MTLQAQNMTIKTDLTRRSFMKNTAAGASVVAVPMAITGCGADDNNDKGLGALTFAHGVASGDPLADRVIIWTRITPQRPNSSDLVDVTWAVSERADMSAPVQTGSVTTSFAKDFTVKVDVAGLTADTTYYYQFSSVKTESSIVGQTKTLPVGYVENVKLAVCSCANYPAGYFNAYDAIGKSDADVVIHLGDYIYEYAVGEYGTTANTIDQGRNHSPEKEVWTLADYRQRYGQYRQDKLLQGAHQAKPFICVWDDHELANDSFKGGAQNHTEGDEGIFDDRRAAAFQAYHEWLPIRTGSDVSIIYRNFKFGELVSMNMMDTRHIARDEALTTNDLLAAGDGAAALIADPSRRLIGEEQLNWLMQEWTNSTTTWEVLGQQVLMGRIFVPVELLVHLGALIAKLEAGQDASAEQAAVFTAITELATIKAGFTPEMTGPATPDDLLRISSVTPYNLDSWDGYFFEREKILKGAAQLSKNVISLAGDTHNAWSSDLRYVTNPTTGALSETTVGAEFATSSISSPGFDEYLSLSSAQKGGFEGAITSLVDDLQYFDSSQRGYMEVVFTPTSATAEWKFVSTIQSTTYSVISGGKQRFRPGNKLEAVS